MFRKLLSNLPFAPNLINNLGFYARRLGKEQATRRLVVVFSILSLAIQVFAMLAPPQASVAVSSNDVIYGGLGDKPKQNLLDVYDKDKDKQGRGGIQALFNYFGISRQAIVHSSPDNISSGRDKLNSVGRNPHSSQDVPFRVGGHSYYLRPLSSWGITTYDALKGTRDNGKPFWVLFDCGNIVINEGLPQAKFSCRDLKADKLSGQFPLKVTFTAAAEVENTTITGYIFNFGDGETKESNDKIVSHTYTKAGNYTATVRIKTADGTTEKRDRCSLNLRISAPGVPPPPPPEQPPEETDTPPPVVETLPPNISLSKQVSNLTTGAADANNVVANATDKLEYRLMTTNTGGSTFQNYQVEEDVQDILEYADIEDISDSGRLNSDGNLVWLPTNIPAGGTITRTFRVKIKQPIPQTARSVSDSQSFDLLMDNVYGNLISIPLPGSLPKSAETVATQLPNTGPGLNLAIAIGLSMLATFFFLRNRQLLMELKLVNQAYKEGGMPWQNISSKTNQKA